MRSSGTNCLRLDTLGTGPMLTSEAMYRVGLQLGHLSSTSCRTTPRPQRLHGIPPQRSGLGQVHGSSTSSICSTDTYRSDSGPQSISAAPPLMQRRSHASNTFRGGQCAPRRRPCDSKRLTPAARTAWPTLLFRIVNLEDWQYVHGCLVVRVFYSQHHMPYSDIA